MPRMQAKIKTKAQGRPACPRNVKLDGKYRVLKKTKKSSSSHTPDNLPLCSRYKEKNEPKSLKENVKHYQVSRYDPVPLCGTRNHCTRVLFSPHHLWEHTTLGGGKKQQSRDLSPKHKEGKLPAAYGRTVSHLPFSIANSGI